MTVELKLPQRNPDAPLLSLRERLATLKGSATKVTKTPEGREIEPRLDCTENRCFPTPGSPIERP